MPGVPLDAKAQVKDGLKRLFRRRHKDDHDTQPTADSGSAHNVAAEPHPAPAPAPAAPQPERYEDEVQYAPDNKEQLVSPISPGTSELDTVTSSPVVQTDGVGPNDTSKSGDTATVPEQPKTGETEGIPSSSNQDATLTKESHTDAETPSTLKEQSAAPAAGSQDETDTTSPAEAKSNIPTINLPDDIQRDGSPTPAMSATSGPLEDYPTLR